MPSWINAMVRAGRESCSPWRTARRGTYRKSRGGRWRKHPLLLVSGSPGTAGNQAPTSPPAVRCDTVGHERGQDLVVASAVARQGIGLAGCRFIVTPFDQVAEGA